MWDCSCPKGVPTEVGCPWQWGMFIGVGFPGAEGAYGEGALTRVPLYTGLMGGCPWGSPGTGESEGAPLGLGNPYMLGISPWVWVPPWDVPRGQGVPSTHLLQRGVLDSVGIVVVVDDLEVGDRWAGPRSHKPHVQGGLPCPPCLHTEVGGGPHLHPCNTLSSHCRAHGTHGTHSP